MEGPFLVRSRSVSDRKGGAVAVIDAATGARATFAGLWNEAQKIADAPEAADLAGRVVLLFRENGVRWLEAFLGLRLAGAIVVPADPGTPPAGLDALVAASKAVAIFDMAGLRRTGLRAPRRSPELFLGKSTSGTTGLPKLRLFTEREMLADADAVCAATDIRENDLNHAGLPFGHSYALGNLVIPLFARGVPLVVASSPMPQVVAGEIQKYGATILPTVPYLVAALHRSDIPREKLATLRKVISAGAKLDPDDARAFAAKFGRRVHNFYGSTETGGVAFDGTGDASPDSGYVGKIMPGVSVSRMRDGRLLVGGPAVFTHGNRRRAGNFGAHVMPDLGRTEAGGVFLEGRAGNFLKIGGRRINPAEIERALRGLPGVKEASVHAVAGPGGEPRLAAVVAGEADAKTLRDALRETLPAWKIPSRIGTVATFPLTSRGKPDRVALVRLLAD